MNRVTEKLLTGRRILSEGEVFTSIGRLNMNWTATEITEEQLRITFELLALKRKYKYNIAKRYFDKGRIRLCYDASGVKISTIQCAPGLSKAGDIALCNLSADLKVDKSVDMNGNVVDTFLVPESDVLYEFLKFGLVTCNVENIYDNAGLRNKISEVYTDLMAEMITRRFGGVSNGDKLRYILKFFFLNGSIPSEALCDMLKFNPGTAKELEYKYPKFFGSESTKTLKLSDMFTILNEEFKAMKEITMADAIKACAIMYSESSVFFMDNAVYLLYIIVNGENKFSQFKSQALKQYAPEVRGLIKEILDICI